MSNTVDNRILEMQFNNKQFESGIQTSLRSLGQLEKGLQLKGAANGLSELDRATKSLSLGHLGDSVDFIASKFTALGIMGVTAMQNIANSAYHTAERMVKSLTVEPIMAGFSEYETQINSIQTILANTQKDGTTLTDVTGALDELNAYADKTIYNFTEMTRNIGTFTAAGVKLDTATNAIQGIANLAAISGSNSQQASTAMYQLSQAMASGTVKLMDWNSVVNAGMGGQVFQDALKETAKAHGVAIDDLIKKHGSFRETLSEGWITTEVLTETLEKFTATTEGLTEEQIKANREMWKARGYTDAQIDAIFEMGKTATDAATKVKTFTQLFDTLKEAAQSGWTQSWEILVGDFEEAKTLLTAISDEIGGIINDSAKLRNDLLQGWKDAGGRDDVLEGLKAMYGLLKDLVEPARQAFEEIFPAVTAEQLKGYTQRFEDFTKKLKVSPEIADRLKRSFKGFFAILDIGAQGLSALASGFAKVVGFALPIGGNLLDMTASLGDFLVELSNSVRASGIFKTAIDTIGKGIEFAASMFEKLTAKGADLFKFFEGVDLSGIEVKIEPIKALAQAGTWALEKLQGAYNKALPFLTKFGSYVGDAFGKFSAAISGMVQDGSLNNLVDLANGGLLAGLIVGVTKIAKAFGGVVENAGGILENLGDIFEGVTGALEGMQNKLNAEALKSIATAVAILAGSLAVLSLVNSDNLGGALASVTVMFMELIGALTALTAITSGAKMAQTLAAVKVMKGLATAVLILAASIAIIGSVDTNGIAAGLVAVLTLMGMLTLVAEKLGSSGTQLMAGAGSLIAFSIAVGILAASVKMLGGMDLASVGKGLLALGGILAELAIFLKVYDFGGIGLSTGLGLMAIAVAIGILSSAIRNMGSMDVGTMAQGLLVMAAGLTALCLAAEALPSNLISAGVGLMAIATALLIVGGALHIMGSLSLEEMAKGLITMGVALAALVVAANMMKGSIGGAAAILVMSAALIALGVALKIIGSMSVGQAVTAIFTLAAALAVIGVGAALLAPVIPAILGLGAAVLVMSIAVAAGGAALLVFGAGLTATSAGITALVTGIVASVIAIVSAVPEIVDQYYAAVIAIAEGIKSAAPVCGEAISVVIQTIIDVLVNGISSISSAVGGVGPAILKLAGILLFLGAAAVVLAPLIPAIVALSAALTAFGLSCAAIAGGVTLLAGALALLGAAGLVVASSLSDIYNTIDAMGDMSMDAVLSCADLFNSAGEKAGEMIIAGLNAKLSNSSDAVSGIVSAMVGAAEGGIGEFANVGEAIGTAFSKTMSSSLQNGVKAATTSVLSAIRSLSGSSISTLVGSYSKFQSTGATFITRLASGVSSEKSSAVSAISSVAKSMASACNGYYSGFYRAGADMVMGLVNGINNNKYLAVNAGYNLGSATKNATKAAVNSNSPSKDFEDIGMWIDMGLANGILKFAKLATNAAAHLGESTIQPVMTMTDNMISDIGSMGSALRGTAALASSLDSSITSEQYVTINHTFEDLTVKGVNNRNEFVAVANYSVEEMMTELMRKGIRR